MVGVFAGTVFFYFAFLVASLAFGVHIYFARLYFLSTQLTSSGFCQMVLLFWSIDSLYGRPPKDQPLTLTKKPSNKLKSRRSSLVKIILKNTLKTEN